MFVKKEAAAALTSATMLCKPQGGPPGQYPRALGDFFENTKIYKNCLVGIGILIPPCCVA